ncbi:MAG TPA: MarR family transcriptional regulator [Longimicrobiales bacterium]|nr:MarR family transcriptional regulator [Longimicrobiales bacterium]
MKERDMEEAERRFVERMARLAVEEGLPRIGGYLLGYLLVHEGRHSLDDLAGALEVSKGSVSTNARLLERVGFVRRTTVPGDRRDYYELVQAPWEHMFAVVKRRMTRFRDALGEGLAMLPEDREESRGRLDEWRRFYDCMLEEMDDQMNTWHAEHAEVNGAER